MEPEISRKLFFDALRIRRVEERIVAVYSEWNMRCPVHLCIGQEAVSAAFGSALAEGDAVFSGHRAHGHYLAAGGNLKALWAEMCGKVGGCCRGKGGSMHLVDLPAGFWGSTPIVGGTIPVAVGAAFAFQMQGKDAVSVVFLGDGATEEGVFHESLQFAALKKLPVVFVCENNLYACQTSLAERQPPGREIFLLAEAHGLPAFKGDGNRIEAVHEMAEEALCRARRGEGPTFLEFLTYRWREHCGPLPDHQLGYRTPEEVEAWQEKCPIKRFEKILLEKGILDEAMIAEFEKRIAAEIDEAIAFAEASPFPEKAEMFENLYAQRKICVD